MFFEYKHICLAPVSGWDEYTVANKISPGSNKRSVTNIPTGARLKL